MKSLQHHRTQFPVGEGSFHAGHVRTCTGSVTYVYDCGAQPTYRPDLGREINEFKQCLQGKQIDLLFLSHAHIDHVNGARLLAAGTTIDTVVMPLLEPTERLMAFANAEADQPIGAPDLELLQSFTVDPVAAAIELGANRVIQVVAGARPSGDGGVSGDPFSPDQLAPNEPMDPPQPVDLPPSPRPGVAQPAGWRLVGNQVPVGPGEDGIPAYTMPDTVHFELTSTLDVVPWVLVTHVDEAIRTRVDRFKAALAQALRITTVELDVQLKDPENVLRLVERNRTELARSYQGAIGRRDLNLTTLSLYSGPDRPRSGPTTAAYSGARIGWGRGDRTLWSSWHDGVSPDMRVGWLGTGDAALREEVRRGPFLSHFRPYAQYVRTLTLPHHGSVHNYSEELVTDLRPEICVAPADNYKNWKHPADAVISSVSQHAVPVRVTAKPASRLHEYAYLYSD